jgi:hypothetical protein
VEQKLSSIDTQGGPGRSQLYLTVRQEQYHNVAGHLIREELIGQPTLNAQTLDFLLSHPNTIPPEWFDQGQYGEGLHVFFWGTIYKMPNGNLCVPYLHLRGKQLRRLHRCLNFDWGPDDPAAVAAA